MGQKLSIVVVVIVIVVEKSNSSHLELAAAPGQLTRWNGAERTWDPQSQHESNRRESVTLKPGSLYRLPADREVRYLESTVRETLTLKPGSLCRLPADGEGGAENRTGQQHESKYIYTLPDEATLKAATRVLKSLGSEFTLEELCERACQSGADRKAEAQRLFQQHKAGGIGWSPEDMKRVLDSLEIGSNEQPDIGSLGRPPAGPPTPGPSRAGTLSGGLGSNTRGAAPSAAPGLAPTSRLGGAVPPSSLPPTSLFPVPGGTGPRGRGHFASRKRLPMALSVPSVRGAVSGVPFPPLGLSRLPVSPSPA